MEDIVEPQSDASNPFLTIWIRPRITIRNIVDSDPERYVILLAIISGIYQALDRAADRSFGDDLSLAMLLLLSIFVGGVAGVFSLFLGGLLFRWSGSILGGVADSRNVRAALAWSSVPDIVLLIIFIPVIIIFGHDWFTSSTAWVDENVILAGIAFAFLAIFGIPILIWKAIILIKCLAEVHGFSAWRGLASVILGFVIVLIPLFLLIFGCGLLA